MHHELGISIDLRCSSHSFPAIGLHNDLSASEACNKWRYIYWIIIVIIINNDISFHQVALALLFISTTVIYHLVVLDNLQLQISVKVKGIFFGLSDKLVDTTSTRRQMQQLADRAAANKN